MNFYCVTSEKSGFQFSREIIPTCGTIMLCYLHIFFHFDFHNICDLFEIIENRKYNISETVRTEKFALIELL
jgi:hypothetical protein